MLNEPTPTRNDSAPYKLTKNYKKYKQKQNKPKRKSQTYYEIFTCNRVERNMLLHLQTGKTFANISAMVSSLMAHEVDGILLDLYTASSRTDLLNDSWAVVSKVVPHKFTYGIVLGGDAAKLYKRFNDYVRNKQTRVMNILQRHEDNCRKVTGRYFTEADFDS